MSAASSMRAPSTESSTPWQAEWDGGVTRAAIVGRGDASHSPQPVKPPARTRTSAMSWLPSPMSAIVGMAR